MTSQFLTELRGRWSGGDALEGEAGVVKELVRQLALGRPGIRLGVIAVEGGRVPMLQSRSRRPPGHELISHHRGPMVHPPVFHVRAFDKFVGLRVISKILLV